MKLSNVQIYWLRIIKKETEEDTVYLSNNVPQSILKVLIKKKCVYLVSHNHSWNTAVKLTELGKSILTEY